MIWSVQPLVRSASDALAGWHDSPRRKPLVLRGARQVGKSTLVREFARVRGLDLLEVNLERHRTLESVFASLDVSRIILEIEALAGRAGTDAQSLLFLDEIQATPSAIAALRYLHEERPGLPVIAAGSLLEAVLRDHDFPMPVGRIQYLHLGPMSFNEYLGAVEPRLLGLIQSWVPGAPFAATAHRALVNRQREFLFVGGMPEAVASFAAGEGINTVRDVHRSIASTYQDDFAKYGGGASSLARLQRVFHYLPGAIGEKVKYSNISREERARELKAAIDLLALARVIWRVHHGDCAGLPLNAQIDPHRYKCLFLDVGLVAHITGVGWPDLSGQDDRRLVNEGGLAEQFIGQHLLFRHGGKEEPFLCYWLREGKRTNAEVDYVIDHTRQIIPVEVKAGRAGSLKSLHAFFARQLKGRAPRTALRFDLNPPSLGDHDHRLSDGSGVEVQYKLLSLPLYMVGETTRLLSDLRETD